MTASGVGSIVGGASIGQAVAEIGDVLAGPGEGPPLVVGALPFDHDAPPFLFRPKSVAVSQTALPAAGGAIAQRPRPARPMPSPAAFVAMVRRALAKIDEGAVDKLVLSRSLVIDASSAVDPLAVMQSLGEDRAVTRFLLDLPARRWGRKRVFFGATPELLVSRTGSGVMSHPLAGSATRSSDMAEDRAAAEALMRSAKDRREHAIVVEAVLDRLAPYCDALDRPTSPTLYGTTSMWHLGSMISGTLKPGAPDAAGLAALLHPTPAVGGMPHQAALDLIREIEPHDRGFYAGAIGWVDAAGDGEWHVALRCAEMDGPTLTLYAGAGIVGGSDPAAELAETSAKFAAMLRALGLPDEQGALLERTG